MVYKHGFWGFQMSQTEMKSAAEKSKQDPRLGMNLGATLEGRA